MERALPRQSAASPKLLHLALDEKFIPFARRLYETAFPGRNRFRVMAPAVGTPQHVQQDASLRLVPRTYWFSRDLRSDLQWCDCLVVHCMTPWFARAVQAAPPNVAVVWSAWGADYYGLIPQYAHSLLLPETKRIAARLPLRRNSDPRANLAYLLDLLLEKMMHPTWERRVLARVDAVTMLPAEFRLLKEAHPLFRAKLHHLQYSSVEEALMQGPERMEGPDILLGNSATATNNHAEAIALLGRLDLRGRRVIVPLSYGDTAYADQICRIGVKMLGEHFTPLRDFVSLAEFNRLISTCGTVLMNHARQQAFSTVNSALFKGAKVFLRPENLMLPFYRDLGIHACDVPEHAKFDSRDFFEPLTQAQRRDNRNSLLSLCSSDRVLEGVRSLEKFVNEKRGTRNV